MFNSFEIQNLRDSISNLRDEIDMMKQRGVKVVDCEECGHLVRKDSAISKKFIEKTFYHGEECVTKYFCKGCFKDKFSKVRKPKK